MTNPLRSIPHKLHFKLRQLKYTYMVEIGHFAHKTFSFHEVMKLAIIKIMGVLIQFKKIQTDRFYIHTKVTF